MKIVVLFGNPNRKGSTNEWCLDTDVLTLHREENKFDSNAILILNEDKKKLGYVPEKDNIVFARLMDAGKLLKAKIT